MNKRIPIYGLLTALALVLSYLEAQLPVFFAVPGMKLGLTNLVVLAALYRMDEKAALSLNIVRIVLVAFTFGNVFSMLYSLAGGILSWLVMILLKRSSRFSMVGVSVAGGIAHNIGQIVVACFVLETGKMIYYLPVLMISGLAAGIVIGLISGKIVRRLPADFGRWKK